MKTRSTRFLSMLLAVLMIFSLLPMGAFAAETGDTGAAKTYYVLAGGDFQEGDYPNSAEHTASAENVSNILAQIKPDYPTMDGFLFAGDYDADTHGNTSSAAAGVAALMNTVQASYENLDAQNSVLIQGNHDPMIADLDSTGGQTFDGYNVFVIDENSFPEGNASETTVKATANQLKSFLEAHQYDNKPVFVITHVPLAYGTRTYQNGDGKYAKYIFDVLNEAGENGMNIIFMHGHDHAYGCDNPLGGEAIYLRKGDKINIAQPGNQRGWTEETLNFTYMNAGYVGYYNETGYTFNERDDNKLTMTVFAITGNEVKVERYNAYGLYNLKSAGRDGYYQDKNNSYSATIGLTVNTTVYASPQTIAAPVITDIQEWSNDGMTIKARTANVTNCDIAVATEGVTFADSDNYARYKAYTITPTGSLESGKVANVTVAIPSGYDRSNTKLYKLEDGALTEMTGASLNNGKYSFTTTDLTGTYVVAMEKASNWIKVEGGKFYTYELDTNGVDRGSHYIIVAPNKDVCLADLGSGTGYSSVLEKPVIIEGNVARISGEDTYTLADWTFGGSNSDYTLRATRGVYLKLGTGGSGDFSYESSASNFRVNANSAAPGQYQLIRLYSSAINADLMYSNGWTTDKVSNATNNSHPNPHYVRLYKYTGTTTVTGGYLYMEDCDDITVNAGTTKAAVENIIKQNIDVWYNASAPKQDGANEVSDDVSISFDENFTTAAAGNVYIANISYNGTNVGSTVVRVNGQQAAEVTWKELSGDTVYKYTLDTNGVDANAHYLVVAPNAANAFGNDSTAGHSVTISGTTATVDAATYNVADWLIATNGTVSGPTSAPTYSSVTITTNNYSSYKTSSYVFVNGEYYPVSNISYSGSGSSRKWTITYNNNNSTQLTGKSITLYTQTPGTTTTWNAYSLQGKDNKYLNFGVTGTQNFAFNTTKAKIVINRNGSTGEYQLIQYASATANADMKYSNGWTLDKDTSGNYAHGATDYVRLYKYDSSETAKSYLALDGKTDYTVPVGTSAEAVLNAIKTSGETSVWKNDSSESTSGATDVIGAADLQFTTSYNGTAGNYEVKVSYQGIDLGNINVSVGEETQAIDWKEIAGEIKYKYTLDTDGLDKGSSNEYLIVAGNTAKALVMNGNSREAINVTITGNDIYLNSDTNDWTFSNASEPTIKFVNSSSTYLGRVSGDSNLNTSATTWAVSHLGSGKYKIYDDSLLYRYYLYYGTNGFTLHRALIDTNSYYVRLYKYTGTEQEQSHYLGLDGKLTYDVPKGTSSADVLNMIKSGGATQLWYNTSSSKDGATDVIGAADLQFVGASYNPNLGSYKVKVSYNGVTAGYIVVNVKTNQNITLDSYEGTVKANSPQSRKTGSNVVITNSNGSSTKVPVTLSMLTDLNGNPINVSKVGDYDCLVNYGGYSFNYTLHVVDAGNADYPEYPEGGSVRVNKSSNAKKTDFQHTGVAQIELSATGVPYERGVDVIIMLDTSSSMARVPKYDDGTPILGPDVDRRSVFAPSFKSLIDDLQASESDIRVAIADFNGFNDYSDNNPATSYSRDYPNDRMADNVQYTASNSGILYTGENAGSVGTKSNLNASAFVNVESVDSQEMYNKLMADSTYKSGTNYDYAFWATYQMAESVKAQNAAAGENRELVVVFMTDGAPMQYNGYHSQGNSFTWGYWLDGTHDGASTSTNAQDYLQALTKVTGSEGGALTTNGVNNTNANNHNYYFGGIGEYAQKHRWNEAVKGNGGSYEVIDKLVGGNYMTSVPGLGATVYSIGFALDRDGNTEAAHAGLVVKQMASSVDLSFNVTSAEQLDSAFKRISGDIVEAATNARFVDTMGADYNLQLANSYVQNGETKLLSDVMGEAPSIEVLSYAIYKNSDVDGVHVTRDMVGKRTGGFDTLEVVTFNENGTFAYSDQIVNESDVSPNILINGVICAKTFWYNTNAASVMIDTDGDGTEDYSLAPETFYWKLGTIRENELALRYYVYLDGTMEGEREAGVYPTNESAVLYYTNHLGHDAQKATVSPKLPWQSAQVSYAFYLVDQNGRPIVNKDSGETGSFVNKVALTEPVSIEVLLNSGQNIQAINAFSSLPTNEYELYDPAAEYEVIISSDSDGNSWEITGNTNTTYVTEYNGADFTNKKVENSAEYDYTHTTVWFAVKYESKAIEDAVVIDYGLPVEISALANDMLSSMVKITGISTTNEASSETSCKGKSGSIAITNNGNKLTYTPTNMQMDEPDVFYYTVKLDANNSVVGTVTVIPATKVYYEDNFVSFTDSKAVNGDKGVWTTDGTVVNNATQAEDRPGEFSFQSIDANNIYGFDGAYNSCSTFSLGSAMKVTVDETSGSFDNAPRANFTFTGTGFDIISLTDNKSGMIFVTIKNHETGEPVDSLVVDNYYGYGYNAEPDEAGNHWYVTGSDDENALYQIPVIKYEGLTHGTYDVEILAGYMAPFDVANKGHYSIWIDAIRIYDPAQGNVTAEDAYELDKESSPDYAEIRNLIIEAGEFYLGKADNDDSVGVVFIDGIPLNAELGNFEETGPNNETYLDRTQAVAFQLLANKIPESVQIGAKLANGTRATLYFNGKEFRTLTTATDMYYELTGLGWKDNGNGTYTSDIIILQNASENGSVISLTNLKITGGAKFLNDISDTADPVNAVQQANGPALTAMVSPLMAKRALSMVNTYSEPVVYVYPEIISVTFDDDDVRTGETVTATIVASADTDYIIVNGERINDFTVNADGNTVWTYSFTAEEVGDTQIAVIACNNNGTESQSAVYTVSVAEADSEPETDPEPEKTTAIEKIVNTIKNIFNKLFGWISK